MLTLPLALPLVLLQTTVREALLFSCTLRLYGERSKESLEEFVDDIMQLVELQPLRNALVGVPGQFGLSVEQRKRLTIAVELVANPSIVFMDEPTSGDGSGQGIGFSVLASFGAKHLMQCSVAVALSSDALYLMRSLVYFYGRCMFSSDQGDVTPTCANVTYFHDMSTTESVIQIQCTAC